MNTVTRNIWIAIIAVLVIIVGAILVFRTNKSAEAPAAIGTTITDTATTTTDTMTPGTTPAGTTPAAPTGYDQKG